MFIRLFMAIFLLKDVTSYQPFQQRIPNGVSVPFPCKSGQIWEGVGHFIFAGNGARNSFGLDFAAAGFNWTVDLCRKDSDGDGLTNGAELGDPDCVWKGSGSPKSDKALSHPGICDPWNSLNCSQKLLSGGKYKTQKEWMTDVCKSEDFECPALNDPDVRSLDIRVPTGTPVPARVTTYKCQIFSLAEMGVSINQDYHIVAATPIMDNKKVLHHMVIIGCLNYTAPTAEPYDCGMQASPYCQDIFNVWTVGLNGECYHPQSGFRIGRTGVKIVAIQLHWNNIGEQSDLTDSSGIRIYFTPNLRPYDAGVFMIGSAMFHLPPRQEEVIVHSTCASSCTNTQMVGPVNITAAWNHMHYAGRKMHIEVDRTNKPLINLTDDKAYSYESPVVFMFPTPFVLLPGDELKTTCSFNTMDRNMTTSFGEATHDEMCLGFLIYYPKENLTSPDCTDQLGISPTPFVLLPGDELKTTCSFNTMDRNMTTSFGEATHDEMCLGFLIYYPKENLTSPDCTDQLGISFCNPESLEGCTDIFQFMDQNKTLFQEVSSNCRMFAPCVTECVDTVVKYMRTEPCFHGNVWEYLQNVFGSYQMGRDFLSRIVSCKDEVALALRVSGRAKTTAEASALILGISLFIIKMLI